MNDDLKNLLQKLDSELKEMYDCFIQDETNLALFHLGAMQSLVSWCMEKYNVKTLQDSNQNSERIELDSRALDKETQTAFNAKVCCAPRIERSASPDIKRCDSNNPLPGGTAELGRGQFTILNEMDQG